MTIARITLRRLRLPLRAPYRLSYRTFTEFEPFLVTVEDADGGTGAADGHVSPGSSSETREGGWAHLVQSAPRLIGQDAGVAATLARGGFAASKVATTALVAALEMVARPQGARIDAAASLPLLVPIGGRSAGEIEAEVEAALAAGYRTLKVKVGRDLDDDLDRVARIQAAAGGRARLRLDANRAYSRDDAIAFARAVDPGGIELFEQPCEADLWDDNAAVAASSDIPVMLDEPICTLEDIERAAGIDGVAYCKVKLKRFGGLAALEEGIRAIRAAGMEAVLGDGLGSDLHAWLEAVIAARLVGTAGEFNGFLKMTGRLFADPLRVENGALRLSPGGCPPLDRARIEAVTVERIEFH